MTWQSQSAACCGCHLWAGSGVGALGLVLTPSVPVRTKCSALHTHVLCSGPSGLQQATHLRLGPIGSRKLVTHVLQALHCPSQTANPCNQSACAQQATVVFCCQSVYRTEIWASKLKMTVETLIELSEAYQQAPNWTLQGNCAGYDYAFPIAGSPLLVVHVSRAT